KFAQDELAPSARITYKAMSAMPPQANSLAGLPGLHVFTNRVNPTRDFMPWSPRILNSRPISLFNQHVAVANSACLNLDAHLSAVGFRGGALDGFEIPACFVYLNDFHNLPSPTQSICLKCF